MRQSTGKGRSAWFWVGVALLSISVLFWLIFILPMIIDEPEDAVYIVITGVIFTGIPIGIGIYCVRRGRKAKDTGAEIVIRLPGQFLVLGWLLVLLLGIPFILIGLDLAGLIGWDLADKNLGGGLGLIGVGLFSVLVGIWFVGWTTKVTLNQPARYVTVTHGHIPVFLWFLRTKRISVEEARSARSSSRTQTYGYTVTAYPVKIVMKSGKELKLYGFQIDEAEPLAQRIREFGQQ